MKLIARGLPVHLAGGPPSIAVAGWLLRLAVLGYCLGAAALLYHKLGSGVGTYLFLEWGIDHPPIARGERIAAYVMAGLGFVAFCRPHWTFLTLIAGATLVDSWTRYFNGGVPFSDWIVWAHGLRYLTPLALLLLYVSFPARILGAAGQLTAVAWYLRLSIAMVFITHGLEAYQQNARFVDYIIGTTENVFGVWLREATVGTILRVIGVVDIVVAVALLIRPMGVVLYWMAFWGLITALARVTTLGTGVYYEVLLRFPHFLAPLAVWWMYRALREMPREATEAKASSSVLASEN